MQLLMSGGRAVGSGQWAQPSRAMERWRALVPQNWCPFSALLLAPYWPSPAHRLLAPSSFFILQLQSPIRSRSDLPSRSTSVHSLSISLIVFYSTEPPRGPLTRRPVHLHLPSCPERPRTPAVRWRSAPWNPSPGTCRRKRVPVTLELALFQLGRDKQNQRILPTTPSLPTIAIASLCASTDRPAQRRVSEFLSKRPPPPSPRPTRPRPRPPIATVAADIDQIAPCARAPNRLHLVACVGTQARLLPGVENILPSWLSPRNRAGPTWPVRSPFRASTGRATTTTTPPADTSTEQAPCHPQRPAPAGGPAPLSFCRQHGRCSFSLPSRCRPSSA